jgi:hypothetical protein
VERKESAVERVPPPTVDEKRRADEVLGQLDVGLRHLIQNYDSDATESSSGKSEQHCDSGLPDGLFSKQKSQFG